MSRDTDTIIHGSQEITLKEFNSLGFAEVDTTRFVISGIAPVPIYTQDWDFEKEKLSHLLKEYLETKQEIIIGYSFTKAIGENGSLGESVYFLSEREYTPEFQQKWLHANFQSREEGIKEMECCHKKYYLDITVDFDKVEAIRVNKKPSIEGFYKWLIKN